MLLEFLSASDYLLQDTVVIALSQSVSCSSIRTDGLCPTLGTGEKVFFPARASFLSAEQALLLQGIGKDMLPREGLCDGALQHIAGNAVSVPVLAAVMAAALGEMAVQGKSED